MQSVIDTLDGAVPSMFGRNAMRWMPPEQAAEVRARYEDVPMASHVVPQMPDAASVAEWLTEPAVGG